MVEFKVGDRVQVKPDVEWLNDETWTGAKITFVHNPPSAFYDVTSNCGKRGMLHLDEMGPYKPNPNPIPAAIAERAMALVGRMASIAHGVSSDAEYAEARAIIDALKPIDGDLVAARAVCGDALDDTIGFLSGDFDEGDIMKCTIAAIAKGRSLERGGE